MTRTTSLVIVAAMMSGAALIAWSNPEPDAVAAPFWLLHGAAPAAEDTPAITRLRLTSRHEDGGQIVMAGR